LFVPDGRFGSISMFVGKSRATEDSPIVAVPSSRLSASILLSV
jgi:hypothetical protein